MAPSLQARGVYGRHARLRPRIEPFCAFCGPPLPSLRRAGPAFAEASASAEASAFAEATADKTADADSFAKR